MRKTKKLLVLFIGLLLITQPKPARADLFGGDVAVLTQILVQAILQLAKLKEMFETANNQLDLLKDINKGINDSLNLLRTIDPNIDPGIYKNWETVQSAIHELESIYGIVVHSPEARVQKDTDQGIAEAITFNNNYYKWSAKLDELGEAIKSESHSVSPGGAQKLTAQAMGLLIQVMNQNLRAQATQLKLQAQGLAVENYRSKEETKHFLDSSQRLKKAMQTQKIQFELPRY